MQNKTMNNLDITAVYLDIPIKIPQLSCYFRKIKFNSSLHINTD